VSSGTVSVGFGQSVGSSRVFPVRGYANGEVGGRRAATGTAELRLPLALVGRSIGHLPVGADKFSLALFADAGGAWDPGDSPRLARLHAVGAELVADFTASYDFLLRVRFGLAQPARRPAQLYAAFTSDF
jgi:outer membrane protein assembly factor BamA